MTDYYAQEEIVDYWNARHEEWDIEWTEEHKLGHFAMKADWFESRFSHILPVSENPKPGMALDLGCGCGMYSVPIKRRFSNYRGIDTSPKAIEIARRYFSTEGWDASRYNGSDIPFFDGWFDCVITITVLQHQPIENRLKLIGEIKRVLKPDGIYVGLEMQGDTQAWDMPKFPVQQWKEAWLPWVIVEDDPPVASWKADNVWLARLPK